MNEGIRHPATFLLEAADDISYICDDLEDGVKKGLINWEKELLNIQRCFDDDYYSQVFESLTKMREIRLPGIPEKMSAEISGFRTIAQSFMIKKVIDLFMQNYESIMCGEFGVKELLYTDSKLESFVKHLKRITKDNCFNCKEVLSLELTGNKVIRSLLDIYIPTIIKAEDVNNLKTYAGKLYDTISPNYRFIAKFDYSKGFERQFKELSMYEKLQLVKDNISGMTDSFAVNLYKKLAGINLPNGD